MDASPTPPPKPSESPAIASKDLEVPLATPTKRPSFLSRLWQSLSDSPTEVIWLIIVLSALLSVASGLLAYDLTKSDSPSLPKTTVKADVPKTPEVEVAVKFINAIKSGDKSTVNELMSPQAVRTSQKVHNATPYDVCMMFKESCSNLIRPLDLSNATTSFTEYISEDDIPGKTVNFRFLSASGEGSFSFRVSTVPGPKTPLIDDYGFAISGS